LPALSVKRFTKHFMSSVRYNSTIHSSYISSSHTYSASFIGSKTHRSHTTHITHLHLHYKLSSLLNTITLGQMNYAPSNASCPWPPDFVPALWRIQTFLHLWMGIFLRILRSKRLYRCRTIAYHIPSPTLNLGTISYPYSISNPPHSLRLPSGERRIDSKKKNSISNCIMF